MPQLMRAARDVYREAVTKALFTAQHGGVAEALVYDPDGRMVSLETPIAEGIDPPQDDNNRGEVGP